MTARGAADDLDDGLAYDFDSAAGVALASDTEPADTAYFSDAEDTPATDERPRKKQKTAKPAAAAAAKPAGKKKKREEGQAEAAAWAAQKVAVARGGAARAADFLARAVRRRHAELSAVEVADRSVPARWIADRGEEEDGEWDGDGLAGYPGFVQRHFAQVFEGLGKEGAKEEVKEDLKEEAPKKKMNKKSKKRARLQQEQEAAAGAAEPASSSPARYVVILAASALRVCDINRALRPSPGGSIKLIKKNKPGYDAHMFATARSRVAVATAGRLQRVLDLGYLAPAQIAAVVADSSFLDAKAQHLWDLPDAVEFVRRLLDSAAAVHGEDSPLMPKLYLY